MTANPGPPEQCYDDCPTNRTGDTEDCTCAGTMLNSDAALFARQRDDARAIVLAVSRILGISHLADGLEHGRVTDAVRSWMDTAVRLTRERDEAQAEVDAVTAERDKLANDLGDLNLIHSVVTENEDNLRGAGHWIAGLFNRDPEDHQIAEVLREVAEELIAWRTDSTQVPDGWRSLVRKGWSVGARPAIPADRPPVVCLCGSMRFEDEIREAAREESLFGHIVVLPLCNMKQPHPLWADEATAEYLKAALDSLHKAKIDLADEIVVVSDATGYVGDSTRSEIAYAVAHGKPVRYWSAPVSGSSGAARAGLLAKYGPCTCQAGECVEDVTDCAPCSHLDPYWDCFAESAPVSGSDTIEQER